MVTSRTTKRYASSLDETGGTGGGTTITANGDDADADDGANCWADVLPTERGSHNSARIVVPDRDNDENEHDHDDQMLFFDRTTFRERLKATITACRAAGKSSLWVEVPMSSAALIEDMVDSGLTFHHAEGRRATLNLWLADHKSSNKIPVFATHHVGVGAFVVHEDSQRILCVRELRRNYLPWKLPTGLSELGETIDEAAVREAREETGIETRFRSVLGFRQTHGKAHGRSDLFFVCRLEPINNAAAAVVQDSDDDNAMSPGLPQPQRPVPQACEIERAEWIPLSEYREMVRSARDGKGHPMMQRILEVYDDQCRIDKTIVSSVVPGQKPNPIFYPVAGGATAAAKAAVAETGNKQQNN